MDYVLIPGTTSDKSLVAQDFLNWTATNEYKSSQGVELARLFGSGHIKENDTILFMDFWNPVVFQAKYMSIMTGIKVKLIGLAHAGHYDKFDRLHYQSTAVGQHLWAKDIEQAFATSYDKIVFATQFHLEMYEAAYGPSPAYRCGFPMEYIRKIGTGERKAWPQHIIFSQRLAPEKQPELFDELTHRLEMEYECVNMFKKYKNPTKQQYHEELNKASLYISFSLQETLGITPYEALACGCNILVPDRLAYKEMYSDAFKYPSDANMGEIIDRVRAVLYNPKIQNVKEEFDRVGAEFFSSNKLLEILK
jgi:hypothetical protein